MPHLRAVPKHLVLNVRQISLGHAVLIKDNMSRCLRTTLYHSKISFLIFPSANDTIQSRHEI